MKQYPLLFLLACLCACQPKTDKKEEAIQKAQKTEKPAISADLLITPGKSIGQITVNEDFDNVQKRLGRPDFSDAAMGSALFTWYAGHDTASYQTSIFGHRNMGGKDENTLRVKKILVTSPDFKTADSVHTGIDLEAIKTHYNLTQKGQYKTAGYAVNIHADTPKGIAFEINTKNNMCVGIMVFKPGNEPATYIDMHER